WNFANVDPKLLQDASTSKVRIFWERIDSMLIKSRVYKLCKVVSINIAGKNRASELAPAHGSGLSGAQAVEAYLDCPELPLNPGAALHNLYTKKDKALMESLIEPFGTIYSSLPPGMTSNMIASLWGRIKERKTAELYTGLGWLYLTRAKGTIKDMEIYLAGKCFLRALELDKGGFEIWTGIVKYYLISGHHKRAARLLKKLQEIRPHSIELQHLQVQYAFLQGDYHQAMQLLRSAHQDAERFLSHYL
ncbi:unnamed protein product, partial [marine sediment metagenome]